MKKVEFHVHTRYSNDSLLNSFFLAMMCKIKKIDCIAITDHNELKGALRYQEKLKKKNIEVIAGEEIFTKDGEIIGLFLTKKIEPNLTCKETIQQIKEQGGLVYVPHPYEPYRSKTVLKERCIEKYQKQIDLIEVHNGRNRKREISEKQLELAEKYNLTKVVGSDAHTFFELGRNNMCIATTDKEQLISSIKCAKLYNQKECIQFAHTWTKIARGIKMLGRGEFHELFRAIHKKCKKSNKKTI